MSWPVVIDRDHLETLLDYAKRGSKACAAPERRKLDAAEYQCPVCLALTAAEKAIRLGEVFAESEELYEEELRSDANRVEFARRTGMNPEDFDDYTDDQIQRFLGIHEAKGETG